MDATECIQEYRCGQCRAEVLAMPGLRVGWSPPVLCCGQPLRLLEPGLDRLVAIRPRQKARCPRCGYEVHLLAQPVTPLICMVCQVSLLPSGSRVRAEAASAGTSS